MQSKSIRKTKIITVINQKGGVGKSTLAFHVAHAAAQHKKNARVLCLDLDSQGNLSQYLTGNLNVISDIEGGVGLFLEGKGIKPSATSHALIDLLHGHEELDRYDNNEEIAERGYSSVMKLILQESGYDFVIIDTPPAVGFRHLAALCWADVALIPMEPVMSSIVGFQNVLGSIETAVLPLNSSLKWLGIVNRANMRVKSHREKDEYLRKNYGKQILATLATRTGVSDAMEEEPALPVWMRKNAPKELREEWLKVCCRVIAA